MGDTFEMRTVLLISFIFLIGCITRVNNDDGAKFIGYLDEDITYNKGEGFLIKDKGYKIITSKKGVRYVQLIDTHAGGIAVPINSKGCVEPKNSRKAVTTDNSLLGGHLETRIAKWHFNPSTFCFRIRKFGD